MCASPEPKSVVSVEDFPFAVNITRHGRHRFVQISGELDVVTRNIVRRACSAGRRTAVVVEMSGMTFMDCSGYGGLVAARHDLQAHGGSLTLRNPAGQPAELISMLEHLQSVG
jgi:anti-anti-sigma factor